MKMTIIINVWGGVSNAIYIYRSHSNWLFSDGELCIKKCFKIKHVDDTKILNYLSHCHMIMRFLFLKVAN